MDRIKSFIKSMGIGARLYVVLGVFAVLSTISSLSSLREFNFASELFTTVVTKNVSSLSKSNEVRSSFMEFNSILENALNEESADRISNYKDNFATLYQEIRTSVELMSLEEADKKALLDSLHNINSQSSLLFDTKQDSIAQKKLLKHEVTNLQKEHESLLNLIIPVYDDVEFAIMLELDDVLAQDSNTAKAFVDKQTNAMKNFLNLKSDINALSGIYLSTYMLTNEQYIVPMQEKYTASNAAIHYTVESLDNSYSEIKTAIASYLAYGDGEDSLFNKVALSIALTKRLEAKKANISKENLAINQILTKMSSSIDEKSQSSITVMTSNLTMASIIVTAIWMIFIVSAGYMVWFYIRPKIIRRLDTLNREMNQVREGNLDMDVTVEGHDEITDMSNALLRFRDDARQALQDQNERDKERERQKLEQQQLLKNQEQRIMDDVSEIITACGQGDFTKRIEEGKKEGLSLFLAKGMNEICNVTFSSISDIRESISDLSLGKLDVKIDRQYQGIFNDIKDDFNNTIDKLDSLIEDVNKSVSLASKGNFSNEIDTAYYKGFMLQLSSGLNEICKISDQGLSEVKQSIIALSHGDLSKQIEGNYEGEFLEIKTSFNNTLNQLSIIMNDIKNSVSQISCGDFSNAIESGNKEGFLLELAIGINSINTVLDKGLGEFKTSIEELSKGNLNYPVEGEYLGQFNEIKVAVNNTLHQLTTVMNEIKTSATAISQGNFKTRLSMDNKEGFLLDLSQRINEISEVSNVGLSEIGDVLKALSNGDLSKTIVNDYQGTFLEIKELVNGTITKLQTVVDEIQGAANAVQNGDFTVRVDMEGKEGFLLGLSESMNEIGETSLQGLTEIEFVLKNLSEGSLVNLMEGDYKGTFDDIKNTLNSTITQLHDMVVQIMSAAHSVNDASSEISDGSQDLSRRTEVQATTLEETTAATEQLTLTVKTNTESAHDANDKARKARNIAVTGEEIVGSAIDAMSRIEESSSKVTDIIGVIDEIAFQTNLLALNAAVEAARAGEAGKGFAVVASEVRNLAGRSATASKEIKDLINLSVGEVQNGSDLVKESGITLSNIIESVNNVADIVDQIAKASEGQSEGISEVNHAITEMDVTTQQNAALVEQSSASSQSMSDQASILLELTNFFKVNDGGNVTYIDSGNVTCINSEASNY